jgi:uncharacterized protein (DUF2147 family)
MRAVLPTFALVALTAAQAPQPSIEGHWRSPGGNSIIVIGPCGGTLCGKIEWASEKAKQDSRKTVGDQLVGDQLVGAQLLTNLTQDKKGNWQGKLFIPDKNMRVTAKIQLVGEQQLRVSGCAVGKTLCKAAIWTRTDGTLPS